MRRDNSLNVSLIYVGLINDVYANQMQILSERMVRQVKNRCCVLRTCSCTCALLRINLIHVTDDVGRTTCLPRKNGEASGESRNSFELSRIRSSDKRHGLVRAGIGPADQIVGIKAIKMAEAAQPRETTVER